MADCLPTEIISSLAQRVSPKVQEQVLWSEVGGDRMPKPKPAPSTTPTPTPNLSVLLH